MKNLIVIGVAALALAACGKNEEAAPAEVAAVEATAEAAPAADASVEAAPAEVAAE